MKRCEKCGRLRRSNDNNRFCFSCVKRILFRMVISGYLQSLKETENEYRPPEAKELIYETKFGPLS